MKRVINNTHIEGLVYEHKLELKTSGKDAKNPGVQFINGDLSVATDDAMMNVVKVHFTYVTATTKAGKPNATYNLLNSIIEGKIGSVMEHGKENAGKIRIDSAIGLNEWFDSRNNDQLVSIKTNEGGFAHQVTGDLCPEDQRATFEADILITNTNHIEADEENNVEEKLIIKGAVFNFRGDLLPVELAVCAAGFDNEKKFHAAMNYFENLDASPTSPVFTKVKGLQISQTKVRTVTEESAFGDASVKEVRTSVREFAVNWAATDVYDWDSEETILASEVSEKISARELALAEMKKRRDEYNATKGNALASGGNSSSTAVKDEAYDF